jgi:hypothetical protein
VTNTPKTYEGDVLMRKVGGSSKSARSMPVLHTPAGLLILRHADASGFGPDAASVALAGSRVRVTGTLDAEGTTLVYTDAEVVS